MEVTLYGEFDYVHRGRNALALSLEPSPVAGPTTEQDPAGNIVRTYKPGFRTWKVRVPDTSALIRDESMVMVLETNFRGRRRSFNANDVYNLAFFPREGFHFLPDSINRS